MNEVVLDSAEEVMDPAMLPIAASEAVTSVEKCTCPPGFTGYSCEDCAIGYFRESEGPFGKILSDYFVSESQFLKSISGHAAKVQIGAVVSRRFGHAEKSRCSQPNVVTMKS